MSLLEETIDARLNETGQLELSHTPKVAPGRSAAEIQAWHDELALADDERDAELEAASRFRTSGGR